jgi:hypothetical protein
MAKLITVTQSSKPDKKLQVKLETEAGREKTIHVGAKGMDDFTKTKDEAQKQRYIDRHRAREDWRLSGLLTAGFWAKHLLWNKPTLEASIRDTKERFNL